MKAYQYWTTDGQVKEFRTAEVRSKINARGAGSVCSSNLELAVDDFVLVQLPEGNLTIGVIVGELEDTTAKYRVLQKIDLSAYDARVAKTRRVAELKAELNALSERFT